jgi:hypothetical protein
VTPVRGPRECWDRAATARRGAEGRGGQVRKAIMDLDGAGECAKLRTNVEAKAKAERKAALEEEAERRAEREAKDAAQRERERSTQMKLAKQQKVPLPPPSY